MTALLDTHAFIWMETDPTKVPATVLAYLADPACTVHLSVASVWEMTIKAMTGKLVFKSGVETAVLDALRTTLLQLLPIRAEHVYALTGLPPVHKDPFDRLLVAQAIAENAVLLTSDPLIRQYPVRTDW
ncbi:MAG: PIN domain nuclease [Isosphaera sp.]|nr:PIN domain nuclease [Isosphaera sp.]